MKNYLKEHPVIGGVVAAFGALAMGILFFFGIYRFDVISRAFKKLFGILRPFIIGMIFAYLLLPACRFIEENLAKHKVKHKYIRPIAVTFSMIIGILSVTVLLLLLVPQLINSIVSLAVRMPDIANYLIERLNTLSMGDGTLNRVLAQTVNSIASYVENFVDHTLLPNVTSILNLVGQNVVLVMVALKDFLLAIFIAAYILAGRARLGRGVHDLGDALFPPRIIKVIREELDYANEMFTGFLSGKLIDSTIVGILCFIVCAIAAIPKASMVAVLIGVTNIIPFFGPFIGAVPAILLVLLERPIKALVLLIIIVVLQQLDGNYIGPKILGDRTGVSSFGVLFAILFFGGLFGFVGMIIGVPCYAVLFDIFKKVAHRRLEKHKAMLAVELAEKAAKQAVTDARIARKLEEHRTAMNDQLEMAVEMEKLGTDAEVPEAFADGLPQK